MKYELQPLEGNALEALKPLYTAFQHVAVADYGWPATAIDVDTLKKILNMGLMRGSLLWDGIAQAGVGFMLYQVEPHRSLEIKLIFLRDDIPVKTALNVLIDDALPGFAALPGWEVISYPLLGDKQKDYVNYLTWFGFKAVGQAVVKFKLFDAISLEVFHKQTFTPLPEGYRFVSWDARYLEGVVTVLAEAFEQSVDALWDPRFRTLAGTRDALAFVQSGGYGTFHPACTTILLNTSDEPVGVCLLNLVSRDEANIPLIGLLKSEHRHKLGPDAIGRNRTQSHGRGPERRPAASGHHRDGRHRQHSRHQDVSLHGVPGGPLVPARLSKP